ncbi:MAG: FAD-binding protein [Humibacillus sp.]|nr:FAD-binding protein [Humibacillus sp.]MDN5777743.1 FAD-binding protein [Humibacillus sp.]
MEKNWAGNHVYAAHRIERPSTLEQVQHLVANERRVRPLGSRHSFNGLPDTEGVLVSLENVPTMVTVDDVSGTAWVTGLSTYGVVAPALQARGWALGNLASLPHISVAGAVATGTHGSGDRSGSLATAVAGLDIVGADGSLRRVLRGEPDFDGSVVGLGALGVVVGVLLDLEPSYAVRQYVYTGLGWEQLAENFDAITASAYSVSLFTRLDEEGVFQVWRKSRDEEGDGRDGFFGARPATTTQHMLRGGPTAAVTPQLGVPGPWLERLPHFRLEFTPSRGEELQSEYLLPRGRALEAVELLRGLGPMLSPLLQSCELRTVAADDLWLSGAQGRDTVGFHFTWVRDVEGVFALLPAIEAALLPLGARPHWGKCFVTSAADLAASFPLMGDFVALRDRVDPERRFGNAFLDDVLA